MSVVITLLAIITLSVVTPITDKHRRK